MTDFITVVASNVAPTVPGTRSRSRTAAEKRRQPHKVVVVVVGSSSTPAASELLQLLQGIEGTGQPSEVVVAVVAVVGPLLVGTAPATLPTRSGFFGLSRRPDLLGLVEGMLHLLIDSRLCIILHNGDRISPAFVCNDQNSQTLSQMGTKLT